MAKQTRFVPRNTPKGWRINIPAKFSVTGKRERHFYPSRAQAEEAAKKLRDRRDDFGVKAMNIAPSLAEQASAAEELLKPFGASLIDAARFYAEHETKRTASAPMEHALAEFRLRKAKLSDKQVQAYRLMAEKLSEAFPGRMLSAITGDEIEAHITARTSGPGAYDQQRRLINAFWTWCAKKPREWCNAKEMEHIEKRGTVSGAIEVLNPAQCLKLLRMAEAYDPKCVPGFAIALFTGIRRQEIERLTPADIQGDGIEVPASSAKTKRRRFVQMTPTLRAWLKAYPIGKEVLPPNWDRKDRAIRRLAGWRVWTEAVEPNTPPKSLPAWPNNALRHTAASVALASGKPIETLVFEHGHSGGLQVLRNHYIGRMTKADAKEILAIRPQPTTRQRDKE